MCAYVCLNSERLLDILNLFRNVLRNLEHIF